VFLFHFGVGSLLDKHSYTQGTGLGRGSGLGVPRVRDWLRDRNRCGDVRSSRSMERGGSRSGCMSDMEHDRNSQALLTFLGMCSQEPGSLTCCLSSLVLPKHEIASSGDIPMSGLSIMVESS
jgi:hypothetical protein